MIVSDDYVLQDGDVVTITPRNAKAKQEYFPGTRTPVPFYLMPTEAAVLLRLDELHGGDMVKALEALAAHIANLNRVTESNQRFPPTLTLPEESDTFYWHIISGSGHQPNLDLVPANS